MSLSRHNIKHLSASSLSLWRENPGLWSLRYLGGMKDDAGPAAWRGSAVEGGMLALLHGKPLEDAKTAALATYDANCMGEVSDEIAAERELIGLMLSVCHMCPRHTVPIIGSQMKTELWLDGIDVPIIGYLDFLFEDGLVLDLKTTKACPTSPRGGHLRQVAVYMAARNSDLGALLYVTGKKHALFPVSVDDRDRGLQELRRDALSLQRFLSRFQSPREVIEALPMNADDFRWSDAATRFLTQMEAA